MKVNPAAAKRLGKAIARGYSYVIQTRERYLGQPVYWVHIKGIHRTHWNYAKGKSSYKALAKYPKGDHRRFSVDNVNKMRKEVRSGKPRLPPVFLVRRDRDEMSHNKPFELWDGHHRLTSHQAEGKKFIRAIIADRPQHHNSSSLLRQHLSHLKKSR